MSKKHLLVITPGYQDPSFLAKEPAAFGWYLAKNHGWQVTYAYFAAEEMHDAAFEKYVKLLCLGDEEKFKPELGVALEFVRQTAMDYDAIMSFRYGPFSYRMSHIVKKLNPRALMWVKLDMAEGGFEHFYDGTFLRKIKVLPEYWKSRHVDLFTVETRSYYEQLKKMPLFMERIEHLPNGVSMMGADLARLDRLPKENIVLAIGRLGTHQKNTELLLYAIESLPKELAADWQFVLVGSYTEELAEKVRTLKERRPDLEDNLVLKGPVYDRAELYELCQRARIFAMPSRWESFGIALAEGTYFGAVAVMTDYGAVVPELTDGGKLGYIVPVGDDEAYAKALLKAMKNKKLDAMGRKTRSYVRDVFGYDGLTARLNGYLKKYGSILWQKKD